MKTIITKIAGRLFLLISGIGFLFLSYLLIKNSMTDEYIQIFSLLLGIAFGCFSIICFASIIFSRHLVFENDKLKLVSITGKEIKEIQFSDIISYSEIDKHNKYLKWQDLTLFTKNSQHQISSHSYANYDVIKKRLTKGKKRNRVHEEIWQYKINKRYGIGFTTFGLIMLLFFGNIFIKDNQINEESLIGIEGTIINEPALELTGKRRNKRLLELKIAEYPNFRFKLGEGVIRTVNIESLLLDIKKGDKINMKLKKDQFEKKLSRQKEMTYWDRSFNYRIINLYGVETSEAKYYNLKLLNSNSKKDNSPLSMLIIFGLSFIFIGYGVYELLRNRKPAANM